MTIEEIWIEYGALLKGFLHSKISNQADVDDLLQEILIKSHKNLHGLKSEPSIKSWLFQIANNSIIDFYRARARQNNLSDESQWQKDIPWIADDIPEIEQQLARCIEPFIQSLPDATANLLTEIEINGQSQKDYAEQQNIPYSTLKSRIQAARSQLRHLYDNCCKFSLDTHGKPADFTKKPDGREKC